MKRKRPVKKLQLSSETLDELRDEIRAGTPVVGLEPSCAAVFRDELVNLFPHDEDARRLSQQVFLLSELLVRDGALDRLPPLSGRALFHAHCHQKALVPWDGVKEVLDKLGLEVEFPDSGCCGMAGSFGFEAGEHYEISVRLRRAGTPARGPCRRFGHPPPRRWLQLPRADRSGDRTPRFPSGAGSADGLRGEGSPTRRAAG